MKRKLKLTKLTIANLNHVKGGGTVPLCNCRVIDPNQVAVLQFSGAPCLTITICQEC